LVGFDSATLAVAVKSSDPGSGGIPEAVVALFPAENSSPFAVERRGRTGPGGSVTFTSVAPGTYLVYAFTEAGASEWEDPEIRGRFPKYVRSVELTPGKRDTTLEVTLLPDSPDAP
jgi:hypothetical protein